MQNTLLSELGVMYCFMQTTSKVYSYVFNGAVTELLSTSGEEIVSMKLYTHSANEDYSGRMLFVATYDGAGRKSVQN